MSPASSTAVVLNSWVPGVSEASRTDEDAQGSSTPSREQANFEPATLEA